MIDKEQYLLKCSPSKRRFHKHILNAIKNVEQCQHCGTIESLTFHHRDRTQKGFDISRKACYDLPVLIEEVNKCIVLCHKCHSEVEHKENLRLAHRQRALKRLNRMRKARFRPWMLMDV